MSLGSLPWVACDNAPCVHSPPSHIQPAPGAFGYDQAAYTKALSELVDTLPIKKPLTLMVHVRR